MLITVLILIACKKTIITPKEHALSDISEKFSGVFSISAIVITYCEHENTVESQEEVCQNFKTISIMKEIAHQMKKGIYTVGFPPAKEMDELHQEAVKKSMKDDTQRLIDLLFHPSSCTIQ